jgi:integrase
VVSRDRSTAFACGASDGAPEAIQIADRFPVLQNRREAAELSLKRMPAALVEQHNASGDATVTRYKRRRSQTEIAASKGARLRRQARSEDVVTLDKQGMSMLGIADHLRMSRRTVHPQHIKGLYARKLKEGLSPTTVNTLHMMLHKAFDDAVKWNVVARNVCDMVDVPQRAHYEIKPLTVEQAKHLLETAKDHPLEGLFVLALTTGLRRGEILALKWLDIDLEKRTVQVRRIFTRAPGNRYIEAESKTKKSRRSVKLTAKVVDLLKQHRKRQLEAKLQAGSQWVENNLVFCTSLGY